MPATTTTVARPDVAVYARTRGRLIELARGLSATDADREVASCPGWTVSDVVSHLAGIADDVLAGRLDGLGSPAWTDAQVVARRGRSIGAVCAEWAELAPAFEALMQDQPAIGLAAAADAVMHEIDVNAALGRVGDRSSVDVRSAARRYAELAAQRVAAAGQGPIALHTEEGDDLTGGVGGAVLSLTAPAFDILLSLTGRRSGAAILALPWSGDPGPVVELLSPYGPLPAETVA
jgi:uncharacterized protein (TIGR03083 family)